MGRRTAPVGGRAPLAPFSYRASLRHEHKRNVVMDQDETWAAMLACRDIGEGEPDYTRGVLYTLGLERLHANYMQAKRFEQSLARDVAAQVDEARITMFDPYPGVDAALLERLSAARKARAQAWAPVWTLVEAARDMDGERFRWRVKEGA